MASGLSLKNNTGSELRITHTDGAQARELKTDDIAYTKITVEKLTELIAPDGAVCVLTDKDRGGTFVYDSTAIDNGGTVFGKWVRQYDGAVNIEWFGVIKDVYVDNTQNLDKAHKYCVENNKILMFAKGEYYTRTLYTRSGMHWEGSTTGKTRISLYAKEESNRGLIGIDDPIYPVDTTVPFDKITLKNIIFDCKWTERDPVNLPRTAVDLTMSYNVTIDNCTFKNATAYGLATQSFEGSSFSAVVSSYWTISNTIFENNGYGGTGGSLPDDTYDGCDFKDAKDVTFTNCIARYNQDHGFNPAGENISLLNCKAYGNVTSGIALRFNQPLGDGSPHNSSGYFSIIGCEVHDSLHGIIMYSGLSEDGTTSIGTAHISHCKIFNISENAIYLPFTTVDTCRITVTETIIYDSLRGIRLSGLPATPGSKISGCSINTTTYPILCEGFGNNTIIGNTLEASDGPGIDLRDFSDNTISDNSINTPYVFSIYSTDYISTNYISSTNNEQKSVTAIASSNIQKPLSSIFVVITSVSNSVLTMTSVTIGDIVTVQMNVDNVVIAHLVTGSYISFYLKTKATTTYNTGDVVRFLFDGTVYLEL